MRALFKEFSKKYPYLLKENRIEYFSLFGGLEEYNLNLFATKEEVIKEILDLNINTTFPFYILEEPFRTLLIKLAKSDGKMFSLFHRCGMSETLGLELIEELTNANILYSVNSRELPIRTYKKQKIKRELKSYIIEPKIYFTKPYYKLWFSFIESNRSSDKSYNDIINSYNKWGYKLTSLVFEQLSIELLKVEYKNRYKFTELGSFWDKDNEFDLYCKMDNGEYILGECKYKNRPITQSELNKLKSKAVVSNLKVDYYALFSKSGFTHELYKNIDNNLLLFTIDDFDKLI